MRAWLRRPLAGWAYPEIGRLDQALADEQRRAYQAETQLDDERAKTAELRHQLAALRPWARSSRLPYVEQLLERQAQLAKTERTGGR